MDSKNKDPDFPSMCFCVVLIHSVSFIFNVSCQQDDGIVIFDKIAEKIVDLLSNDCSDSIQTKLIKEDTYKRSEIMDKPLLATSNNSLINVKIGAKP